MKHLILFSLLFSAFAGPALADLTDADLDKIRLIVNEVVKEEITTVKMELKAEIATVKQELKAGNRHRQGRTQGKISPSRRKT